MIWVQQRLLMMRMVRIYVSDSYQCFNMFYAISKRWCGVLKLYCMELNR